MSMGIKNWKLKTNTIYILNLIPFIIFIFVISVPVDAERYDKGWVIVIDAGHGGRDPGALGSISYEKTITLAIALKTGEYIKENIKNVTVIYTRDKDIHVDVRDRADIANKYNADLFISIHANWANSKSIKGTETFIMGLAKDAQNLEVAMKENEVILLEDDHSAKYEGFDPKSPESYIMFTLMQNIYQEQSTALASRIQNQYKEKIDRNDRGVKQAGFWVLFMTTMPSVLTETGFITNPAEEKYLNSKQGQDFLATSIYKACKEYIEEIDSKSVRIDKQNGKIRPETVASEELNSQTGEIKFMVQIAASSEKKEVKPENFNGLADIIEISSSGRFRYASGNFSDYPAAIKYKKNLEALFPDAFVIAVKDNKVLPLQQALEQKKNNNKN
jgi:N-acetylmuramoyl-L-alanine amidase